jgi:hypothetical protein
MGITALGIPDQVRNAAARPASAPSPHRRSKLVGAFALTAIVGLGSYVATYRALTVVSTPAASHTVAPTTPTTAQP